MATNEFVTTPVASDLFKPGQNFPHPFPPVHTCSLLFTPVHTSVIIYALHPMGVSCWISPCESCYFSILCPILLKLQIFAHLIESFPAVYGLCSCIEIKIVDPSRSPCFKIVNGKRFEQRNFSVLRPVLLKNAYFSSANRELSNGVRLLEVRRRKLSIPLELHHVRSSSEKFLSFRAKTFQSCNLFILQLILLELHI